MVAKGQRAAANKYNREKMKSIAFRLHKVSDADLIEIYESIPDKMAWFRQCLKEYGHDRRIDPPIHTA